MEKPTEGDYYKKRFCTLLVQVFLESGENTGLVAQRSFVQ